MIESVFEALADRSRRQAASAIARACRHAGSEEPVSDWMTYDASHGHMVALRYCDAGGVFTERLVHVLYPVRHKSQWEANREWPTHIQCWCTLREEPRLFSLDGIDAFIDVNTGEIVEDPFEWLFERFDPSRAVGAMRESLLHDLTILACLARSDGEVCDVELDVVLMHIDGINPLRAGDEKVLRQAILETGVHPEAFRRAVGRVRHMDVARRRHLLRSARNLCEADARLHLNEQTVLAWVKDELNA
jgi:hypothetical protein